MIWNLWGNTTVVGQNLYLHITNWYNGEDLLIGGLTCDVEEAELISTGQKLDVRVDHNRTIISGLPVEKPSVAIPVIRLRCRGTIAQNAGDVIGGADIFPEFPK